MSSAQRIRRISQVAGWPTTTQLLILDVTLLTLTWGASWTLRFEGLGWMNTWGDAALVDLAAFVPLWIVVLLAFRMYRRVWSMASIADVDGLFAAAAVGATLNVVTDIFVLPATGLTDVRLPLSVVSHETLWAIVSLTMPRIGSRLIGWRRARLRGRGRRASERVLIVGAGHAGQRAAQEMLAREDLQFTPVGFLDDDASKHEREVSGLPVFGSISMLREVLSSARVRQVVIAMPRAPGAVVRPIVRTCADASVKTLTVPSMSEIISGRVGISQLRAVEIEDLLRRPPVQTDVGAVRSIVGGKTVVITGAGGSIGSELCRQLARQRPDRLVLLGHGENSIFEIYHELRARFPEVSLSTVIADIRDETRIDGVFTAFHPHAVFHAAAHKHVPLMEDNLVEAITNNVHGTRTVAQSAARHGVPHFVLISSDKAVNPTSIMGASKRIAELVVQRIATVSGYDYVSVRFGNVLGSRGSVVPMFLRQIRAGGPITITHPDMTRYFMTIPEAVQLVLQAAVVGRGGEVLVLDMGEPVRIVDLATDLVRLSGLRLGADIEISFTGLRPGEKLFEDLSRDDEHMRPTTHEKILRAVLGEPEQTLMARIEELLAAASAQEDDESLRSRIAELVPEYTAPGAVVRTRAELSLVA
ncbi:MAG: polysaccharide biosynthesis protein [Gemmatimonadaceae bacterium]